MDDNIITVIILTIFIIYISYIRELYETILQEHNLIKLNCNPINLFKNGLLDINNEDFTKCIKMHSKDIINDKFSNFDKIMKLTIDNNLETINQADLENNANTEELFNKIDNVVDSTNNSQEKLEENLVNSQNSIELFKESIASLKSQIEKLFTQISGGNLTTKLNISPNTNS
tara:strand:- start:3499 stop:4017 length:519 start_codon:yes stop_codon:yes gene_type:complete